MNVLARHLVAEASFGRLSDALSAVFIDHLLLKGPHLAAVAYEAAEERDFVDLDVLIKREALDTATVALTKAGFRRPKPSRRRLATAEAAYDRTFFSPQGFTVELHHALAPHGMYRVYVADLFERAVPFRFGNREAWGLSTEDLLCHLVIHAGKSHFRNLEPKHLRDIRELIERQPLAWAVFVDRITVMGARTAAWVMLSAAAKALAARVPGEILTELRPSLVRRAWLAPWLTAEEFPLLRHPRLPPSLSRLLLGPGMMDGAGQSARSLLRFGVVRARDVAGAFGWLRDGK